MAILQPPKIDDLELTLDQDVPNANFTIRYTINWSQLDQVTNLAYTEVVKLGLGTRGQLVSAAVRHAGGGDDG